MEIAIIGIAGRFPQANNLDELLEVLTSGLDAVRPIDVERLSKTTVPTDKDYVEMAYINDVDLFDYKYFNYPKAEANKMSPHHRLALQTIHHALEDSGYPVSTFNGSNTSVYCASPVIRYNEHWETEIDPVGIMGSSSAFLAGRISRVFNLRGNSSSIDTTCSSSLVALHAAVNDLTCGDSDCSVVVGVNIEDFPLEKKVHISNEELGVNILSSTYRAKTFSDQADGTGIGEAVVAIVIKPLAKAAEDGDRIHAVIKSTAVNQDAGLSASLTAPDSQAQSEVIRDAWKKANINPADLGYIEAHGTGTKLGDPIEIEGHTMAFKGFTDQKQFCSVSSIKSNFGHTDSAAGLVGLTKVVLSLKNQIKFKSVHFEKPNPFIDFENAPVYVQTETAEWKPENGKYLAGISAFGLTGTNAHAVLEAYQEDSKAIIKAEKEYVIPISGRDHAALERNIESFKDYLNQHTNLSIGDVAATLCKGRDHHAARSLFKAKSLEDILESLEKPIFFNTEPVEKIILVFSDLKLSKTDLLNFLGKAPVLDQAFRNLCSLHQLDFDALSERESVLVLQVAMFNTLKKAGVTSEFLMGDGIGKLSIRCIKGQASLNEVIKEADNTSSEKENFSTRIQRFVEGQTKDTRVGFLEMGLLGSISGEIQRQSGNFALGVADIEAGFFGLLQQAFAMGINLNWDLWLSGDEKTVSLPGYVFEPSRCWLKEPYPIVEPNALSDAISLRSPEWISVERKGTKGPEKEHVLALVNSPDQKQYVENWFSGHQVTCVSSLTEALENDSENPVSMFIDTVNFAQSESEAEKVIFEQLEAVKFLDKLTLSDQFKYVFLSTDGFPAKQGDSANPAVYASTAFAKALNADMHTWEVAHIDLKSTDDLSEVDLLSEIRNIDGKAIVTYRDGKPFEQQYALQDLTELKPHAYADGDYVLTGGASGIGAVIAKRIAEQIGTGRLFLLGRSEESERLDVLEELRKINADVSIIYDSLDVSNSDEVDRYGLALQQAGVDTLQALIHAAGIGRSDTPLIEETNESFKGVMAPKHAGLLNLARATASFNPEKTLLFSSLNAVLPYAKSASYAVGNAFMDGYAEKHDKVLSIGWAGWQGIGMSKDSIETAFLLSEKEFLAVFERLMTLPNGHVIVTKGDITQFANNPYAHLEVPTQESELDETLPIREYIHQLWIKILEEPDIGRDDDFFDLGGHSLIGAQLVNILKEKYQVDLDFEDIYEYATINQLADFIEEQGTVGVEQDEVTEVSEGEKKYPLTAAQEGVWIVSQMEERSSDFNMAGLVEFKGKLNELMLEKAIRLVMEKHQTLRTLFGESDGSIMQSIADIEKFETPFLIEEADFSLGLSAIEDIKIKSTDYAFKPFALETEFPIRVKLYTDHEDHHLIVFVTHHIVSDAVSIDILTQEFFQNYLALLSNPDFKPAKLSGTFGEHVKEQVEYYQSEAYKTDKAFWSDVVLKKMPRLKLPYDFEGKETNEKKAKAIEIKFTDEDIEHFREMREELKVSPFILFIALVKLLLFKYNGAGHITLGFPYHGRDKSKHLDNIGLFVNLLALHNNIEGNLSFGELIVKVQNNYLDTLKHKKFPFEHLIQLANQMGQKFEDSIYDVSINYWQDNQDLFMTDNFVRINEHLERKVHGFTDISAQRNLAFEFVGGTVPKAIIKFDQSVFKEITIALMAERFLQLLRNVTADSKDPIENIDYNPIWILDSNTTEMFNENF